MAGTKILQSSWPTVPLGTLLTDIQPGFASGIHNSTGEGIPHLRPMNISTEGFIDRSVIKYVDPALASRPERQLKSGDVLFNNTNSPELVGKTALFVENDAPAFSNHMTRLRTDSQKLDPGYLAMRLHFAWMCGYFAEHCNNHVSQASIGRQVLKDFMIELPPLNVQITIRQILEKVRVKQIAASTHLTLVHRVIERFRQAVFAAACSGRLTADWREKYSPAESANALIDRSRQLLAARSGRELTDSENLDPDWLVLPDSWQWSSLANLAEIKGGIQKQPKRTPKRNAFPYLRVANVHRGHLDLSEIHQFELQEGELEIYRLEPGDLLVVEGNGSASEIGRCALWNGEIADCVHQNHIIRVRCVEMEPRFVELYWNSPLGSREISSLAVTSAGLYSLSTKKIGSVLVPVTPLEEQREVVRRVHALLNIADRLQDRVEGAIQRVERSSQAVLAKAFRGELSTTVSEEQNVELVM